MQRPFYSVFAPTADSMDYNLMWPGKGGQRGGQPNHSQLVPYPLPDFFPRLIRKFQILAEDRSSTAADLAHL